MLVVVLGVLIDRKGLRELFEQAGYGGMDRIREDVLLLEVVNRCRCPCTFANSVEQALDRKTQFLRNRLQRCPMIELAEWWAVERDDAGGEHLAALLWSLASDPRWEVQRLTSRVFGELCIRALRPLGSYETRRSRDAAKRLFEL